MKLIKKVMNMTLNKVNHKLLNGIKKIKKLGLPIKRYSIYSANTILLASFPKSGNTWIRFILGNIYNDLKKKCEEVNFHTVHDIIPELGHQSSLNFTNLPKIFKTHNLYKNNFKNVILILRNPLDIIYSYYKYLNREMNTEISLSEVIYSERHGINAIIKHTNSYIKNCDNLLIITYENMKNNPFNCVKKICNFLNIEASSEIISNTINKSSFESMRKIELEKGRKFGSNNFIFTRSGKIGEGVDNIKEEDRKYIKKILKKSPILNLLYN